MRRLGPDDRIGEIEKRREVKHGHHQSHHQREEQAERPEKNGHTPAELTRQALIPGRESLGQFVLRTLAHAEIGKCDHDANARERHPQPERLGPERLHRDGNLK